jgi:hypothetical protein
MLTDDGFPFVTGREIDEQATDVIGFLFQLQPVQEHLAIDQDFVRGKLPVGVRGFSNAKDHVERPLFWWDCATPDVDSMIGSTISACGQVVVASGAHESQARGRHAWFTYLLFSMVPVNHILPCISCLSFCISSEKRGASWCARLRG